MSKEDKPTEEKPIPIEVKVIKEKEVPEEATEDSSYHEGLIITKEEIEEFEKDGS